MALMIGTAAVAAPADPVNWSNNIWSGISTENAISSLSSTPLIGASAIGCLSARMLAFDSFLIIDNSYFFVNLNSIYIGISFGNFNQSKRYKMSEMYCAIALKPKIFNLTFRNKTRIF